MLIIAIPKSASTSLMKTLGQLHSLSARQEFFPNRPEPQEYSALYNYHGDMREIDKVLSEQFAGEDVIYKQHIPPTENNRELLSDTKKVILLRKPEDIISAYWRGAMKSVHNPLKGFEHEKTEEQGLSKAKEIGLLDDLDGFYNNWLNDSGDKLIVTYEDLLQDPAGVVRKIERYWDLKVTAGPIELSRERYSRVGPFRAFFINKLFKRPVYLIKNVLYKIIKKYIK